MKRLETAGGRIRQTVLRLKDTGNSVERKGKRVLRSKLFLIVIGLLFVLSLAESALAQDGETVKLEEHAQSAATDDASPYDLKKGTYEFGAWGGGSFDSTTWFGRTPNRKLIITGFRGGRVMGSKKHFTFEYTVDVNPYVRLVQPREFVFFEARDSNAVILTESGPDAVGVGISPIGLKFLFRRRERVKPFINSTAGFLYFERNVPYDAGRKFNFAFDVGAGFQVFSKSRNATMFGYKYHHFSNANTADVNPGVDSHIIYAGFSVFR